MKIMRQIKVENDPTTEIKSVSWPVKIFVTIFLGACAWYIPKSLIVMKPKHLSLITCRPQDAKPFMPHKGGKQGLNWGDTVSALPIWRSYDFQFLVDGEIKQFSSLRLNVLHKLRWNAMAFQMENTPYLTGLFYEFRGIRIHEVDNGYR